jgi:hypothetical protein
MLKSTRDLHPKGRWLTNDDPVLVKPKGATTVVSLVPKYNHGPGVVTCLGFYQMKICNHFCAEKCVEPPRPLTPEELEPIQVQVQVKVPTPRPTPPPVKTPTPPKELKKKGKKKRPQTPEPEPPKVAAKPPKLKPVRKPTM